MSAERQDVYERITKQIIEAIEAGVKAQRMPWHVSDAEAFAPRNAVSKRAYRGINVLTLWAAAQAKSYPSGLWATYNQWRELGAQVRAGEKSRLVVLWKVSERGEEAEDDDGEKKSGTRLFAKGFSVFNAAQVDGYAPPPRRLLSEAERVEHAEAFFAALGADIRHGGGEAFYEPESDHIQLPHFEAFRDAVSYYATLAHEATHWTGRKSRLDRDLSTRFGTHGYAMEELVAELGAAFLCSELRLSLEPREDHAAYIENWLTVLKSDKRAIFTAASKAQQAADWMCARQPAPSNTAGDTKDELCAHSA